VGREDLKELKSCIERCDFQSAAKRASELADQFAQLATVDPAGDVGQTDVTLQLRKWAASFQRIANKSVGFDDKKWATFEVKLHDRLDQYFGPFAQADEEFKNDPD
jgi:hypothetical protein